MHWKPLMLTAGLIGCGGVGEPDHLTFVVGDDDTRDTLVTFLATADDPRVQVITHPQPERAIQRGEGVRVALRTDARCAECYRLDAGDGAHAITATAGGVLGTLYAATHAMEAMGYRFHHPFRTHLPSQLAVPTAAEGFGVDHTPEIRRRGLHLHTLHPIEGLFDLWEPDADPARGRAIVDWVVRHRGNHLQWVGLNDILQGGGRLAGWQAQTAAVQAHARRYGVTTGLGIQLFASGNLQLAFDLIDTPGTVEQQRTQMAPRLDAITEGGVDFDVYNLSFGEFFAEEPERFLESLGLAYDEIVLRDPNAEVTTVIHVGDDLQTTYQGETFVYYFLATRTDRPIVPWIHTVMYYNLFEDPGGAYHHEDFDQHRDYLLDALSRQEPVGYFPESAYWIAFDNPVPQSFWVYVRSRWLDLDRVRAFTREQGVPGLDDHVLFASGWEWNHWLFDSATLRMSYALPDDWRDLIRRPYTPYGDVGDSLAEAMIGFGEAQATHLIHDRLTPWIASYDNVMELGYEIGKIAQPVRILPRLWLDGTEPRSRLEQEHAGLVNYLSDLETAAPDAAASPDNPPAALLEHPFLLEAFDGLAIGVLRARFAEAQARALLAALDDEDPAPTLRDADEALRAAEEVVRRRHANLHDPDPERLVTLADNATLYNFGYLHRAETLCYWIRELNQLRNALDGGRRPVPGCSIEKADPPTVSQTLQDG